MKQNNTITEEPISDGAVYQTNFFLFLKIGHIFIIELHFCSLNLKAETMCQKWWVVVCHADPCAKSVQYLDLLNTLIFPKIFSTGDILTLVDHTLTDHTACRGSNWSNLAFIFQLERVPAADERGGDSDTNLGPVVSQDRHFLCRVLRQDGRRQRQRRPVPQGRQLRTPVLAHIPGTRQSFYKNMFIRTLGWDQVKTRPRLRT